MARVRVWPSRRSGRWRGVSLMDSRVPGLRGCNNGAGDRRSLLVDCCYGISLISDWTTDLGISFAVRQCSRAAGVVSMAADSRIQAETNHINHLLHTHGPFADRQACYVSISDMASILEASREITLQDALCLYCLWALRRFVSSLVGRRGIPHRYRKKRVRI